MCHRVFSFEWAGTAIWRHYGHSKTTLTDPSGVQSICRCLTGRAVSVMESFTRGDFTLINEYIGDNGMKIFSCEKKVKL